ncbi:isopentenyl-diphosphate Delta-isomerase [Candidatus Gottesmanbacteria bacterium]|nr:isopentenyl-diphosphate Delta-isomerase [Candidatus Gottesmanbacteria bacterium]
MPEPVVLVDEQNIILGTAPKDEVHTADTPLHRGFSLFLFNSKKELLVTRRAETKKTFPGVWTNTVCGHPGPGESVIDAAKRRLKEELGIELVLKRSHLARQGETLIQIQEVAPYRYRFADGNGIVENEICPILVGYCDAIPHQNAREVADWKWVKWEEFLEEIKRNPTNYSPWCIEEVRILNDTHVFAR